MSRTKPNHRIALQLMRAAIEHSLLFGAPGPFYLGLMELASYLAVHGGTRIGDPS